MLERKVKVTDKFKLWKYLRIDMIYNPNYCEQQKVDNVYIQKNVWNPDTILKS